MFCLLDEKKFLASMHKCLYILEKHASVIVGGNLIKRLKNLAIVFHYFTFDNYMFFVKHMMTAKALNGDTYFTILVFTQDNELVENR
jgi:hypothetical protein